MPGMPRRRRHAVDVLVVAVLMTALALGGCRLHGQRGRKPERAGGRRPPSLGRGGPRRRLAGSLGLARDHRRRRRQLFAGNAADGTFTRALAGWRVPAARLRRRRRFPAAHRGRVGRPRRARRRRASATNLHVDVRYADGTPLPFAWIEVYDADGRAVFDGNAPRGSFDLAVAPGEHRVRAFDGRTHARRPRRRPLRGGRPCPALRRDGRSR